MNWKTRVSELLGSKYPIIQGAFAGFGTSALAAPVSEAGGFGIITAGALRTPEKLREDIRRTRSQTDQPFGVNLSVGFCPRIDEMREAAIEERVPVIFTSAYRADDHGKRIREAGLKWVHKVVTVHHALVAERQGADAVVIVGLEGTAFKNPRQLPTLTSITSAVRLVRIPVIAAGGIGDGRGFLAALAMGAEGVYLGTRFIATHECPVSERYKRRLVEANPWDPEFLNRSLAMPTREAHDRAMAEKGSVPRDQWLQRLEQVMFQHAPREELDLEADLDMEVVFQVAGGSLAVGVIDRVSSVREVIDTIIGDAERILGPEGPLGRLLG